VVAAADDSSPTQPACAAPEDRSDALVDRVDTLVPSPAMIILFNKISFFPAINEISVVRSSDREEKMDFNVRFLSDEIPESKCQLVRSEAWLSSSRATLPRKLRKGEIEREAIYL
jgi:hypothetical protein